MANTVKIGITASDEGFKSTMQNAARSAAELGNAMTGAGGKSKTLNGQLREARKAAMELTMQWRELDDSMKNSDFGQSLKAQLDTVLQRAGELQDIKGDVSSEIQNIASDTMMWDGAKQGIGILSSSIQGMASVVGLCGGNVEAFTKALNVMKGVEAVTNTVIGIGNALQKNSALMVALRAVKTNLLSAAEKEATVAIGAETAATELQTEAQLANNAAVLANPYVLAAAAIIGLTAAIVAWVSATDDATAATEGIHEAVEGSVEANKEGWKTYIKMQAELDMVKKKTDAFNGSMEDEKKLVKELNDKYGESLGYYKSLADWKAALADVSYYYCKVLEKEAIVQALTNRMADAYADMMSGDGDFDKNKAKFEKYQSMIADAVDDLQAYQFMLDNMKRAYGALPTKPKDSSSSSSRSTRSTHSNKNATKQTKEQQTALEKLNKELDKYNKLYDSVKDKEGKGLKKATEYQQRILELEKQKLDYLVKGTDEYDNQVKKIREYYDTSSDEYKKYSKLLRESEIERLSESLDGLDFNISSDRESALSTIREIISKVQEGTAEFDKWQEKFKELFPREYWEDRIKMLEEKRKIPGVDVNAVNDEIDKARQQLESLDIDLGIKEIPQTDYEKRINGYERWLKDQERAAYAAGNAKTELDKKLAEADRKLAQQLRNGLITQEQYNERSQKLYDEYVDKMGDLPEVIVSVYKGLPLDNIARYWQDVISDLEKQLNENDLDVEARLKLIADKQEAQAKLDEITKGELTIKAIIEPEYIEKGSVDDMRASYENQGAKIQQIADDYAKGIIKSSDVAVERIAALNSQLRALGMEPVQIEIKTEGMKTIESMQNYFGMFNDTVGSTVDSIQSLVNAIDEGTNAWEIFKNAISVIETILNDIATVMNIVNTLELAGNAAKEVAAPLSNENAAAKTLEAAAQSSLAATSPAVVTAMETQSAAAITATPGIKAMSSALMELAASNMFAAHASIPFVGAALGAASVGTMMAVMAGVKALSKFADGGIVGGSYTMGDRMLVRANAGEAILNKRQQSRLFRMIDHGNIYGGEPQVSTVRIKGSDLYLSLKNYGKIHNKTSFGKGLE